MSDVYENCPAFENDKFLLRFSQLDDAEDLVSVYSDKNALPFFNSDNCHGDNFYYPNEDRMRQAIKFWLSSYSSKWFVRWTIIDKEKHEAIGTIEVFHRSANDNFNHVGVLRLDLKSEYETSEEIFTIMNLIVPPTFDLFECEEIITKVPVYAVERIEAMKRVGFKKSTKLLVGTMDGYAYKDYWTIVGNFRSKEVFAWRVFGELSFKEIGDLYEESDNWACAIYITRTLEATIRFMHR